MNISLIIGGVLVVLLGITSATIKYQQSKIDQMNLDLIASEVRNQEQIQTIEQLTGSLKSQTEALRVQQIASQEIQAQVNRYLDIFARHNLSRLAAAKPGLIETRVNNGTKEVFDAIQNDSNNLAELNDK